MRAKKCCESIIYKKSDNIDGFQIIINTMFNIFLDLLEDFSKWFVNQSVYFIICIYFRIITALFRLLLRNWVHKVILSKSFLKYYIFKSMIKRIHTTYIFWPNPALEDLSKNADFFWRGLELRKSTRVFYILYCWDS